MSVKDKPNSEERDFGAEHAKRLTLFEQCKHFPALKEYVENLTRIHETVIQQHKAATETENTAREKIKNAEGEYEKAKNEYERVKETLQQKIEEADAYLDSVLKNANNVLNESAQVFTKYDSICKQLEIALVLKQSHESQGDDIYKPIVLPPLKNDAINQTQLCTVVETVPFLEQESVTETIELLSLSQERQWKVTKNKETGNWEIADTKGKTIILIRRSSNENIQVEWAQEMEKGFDLSVNDVRFSILVIIHTVTVGEKNFSLKQYRPLFDADRNLIKKINE